MNISAGVRFGKEREILCNQLQIALSERRAKGVFRKKRVEDIKRMSCGGKGGGGGEVTWLKHTLKHLFKFTKKSATLAATASLSSCKYSFAL